MVWNILRSLENCLSQKIEEQTASKFWNSAKSGKQSSKIGNLTNFYAIKAKI